MSADADPPAVELREALAKPVYCGDSYTPFGELGAAEARRLSTELGSVGSWGPMTKVGSVSRSWQELAEAIEEDESNTVADLEPDQVIGFAKRLWILPPSGGIL